MCGRGCPKLHGKPFRFGRGVDEEASRARLADLITDVRRERYSRPTGEWTIVRGRRLRPSPNGGGCAPALNCGGAEPLAGEGTFLGKASARSLRPLANLAK